MIGVSLPFDWLLTEKGPLPSHWFVFNELKKKNVKSIELRAIRPGEDANNVLYAANLLWDFGFQITIHSTVVSCETAVEDVFSPLKKLFPQLRQKSLNITIHPIDGDNISMLLKLSDYILAHQLPFVIALENNRRLPNKAEGDSESLVLAAVKAVNRDNVGICFDMGHYAFYTAKFFPDMPDKLPSEEFLRKVVHTHIHAVNDQLETHYPLDSHNLPLKKYLDALGHGYFGVYNLELEFPRFLSLREPMPALMGSVDTLQGALPICAKVYDEVREHFESWLRSSSAVIHAAEPGTRLGLLRSSCYLFNTNGYPWAMDLTFLYAWKLTDAVPLALELFRDLKLMIITHAHADHFEERTVRMLSQLSMDWVVPDFLGKQALEYGIRPEKLHLIHAGEALTMGPLTIQAFEGHHFRPTNHKGIDELCYHISAENAPSLAFPADVRDYSLESAPAMPPADYCFAHVWLGDDNCLDTEFPMAEDFAHFMLQYTEKNIFLTHLWESSRTDEQMWRDYHAQLVTETIHKISPKTIVRTPQRGEIMRLL